MAVYGSPESVTKKVYVNRAIALLKGSDRFIKAGIKVYPENSKKLACDGFRVVL
jgi:hypothetical protein